MTQPAMTQPATLGDGPLLKQHPDVRAALTAFDAGDFRTARAQLREIDRSETTAADVDALRALDRGLRWDWAPVAVGVTLLAGWAALFFGAI